MSISVTCPRCQAGARVPESMLGQVVRCPHCLMPFRTPASMPVSAPPPAVPNSPVPEEPPLVVAASGPIDDVVVPVVRVRKPAPATARPKRVDTNAGLRTGLAIGAAVFLIVGAVGAGLFVMAANRDRGPTFRLGGMQPQLVWPAEKIGRGDPRAGAAPLHTRSRPQAKPLADVRMPDSREHRVPLAGPRRSLPGGFTITPVQIDDANDIIALCWTSNGDSFVALSGTGRLRLIRYPSLDEVRRLDLGQKCDQMTLSGDGLLVTLRRLEEVWVIDPESLEVRRRIGLKGLREVVSGPEQAVAMAIASAQMAPLRIDLTTGIVSGVGVYQDDQPEDPVADYFRAPTLTPDGRFLFAVTEEKQVARYRVEDDRLTLESVGRRGPNGQLLEPIVSPGGRWVSAVGQVIPADDLRRPAFDLSPTASAAGFDSTGRRVFVSTRDDLLATFDLTGRPGPAAAWPDGRASARQILVHPPGEGVLLRTDTGVLRVETPDP